jgi:hypothetical protein
MSESTATSITATGTTGSTCSTPGPYKCTSHATTIVFFAKGQKFSACPNANSASGHNTTWRMVSTT